ncbi:transcriptional regulator [Staphylococcus microti]|uniref:Transcriptional regulator n=1 Tax=Staphylococcus microti TaxID=569857 RepID=A0A0D6XQS9_9STAP|nr:XRE family transcriptional regulator [Staphylococcus microti]KIX90937.1 transcriptional regulator [Staphylococcus microti]PNZ83780.1 XRE family transcriptional regulator [Staphylococcus microti]SUM58491.1 transcriptional regulator [Staphylococcus microti]
MNNIIQKTHRLLTGISQIEKGTGNPSINTLWKLANGLHLPLNALISYDKRGIQHVATEDLTPIYNDDQSVIVYPYFPYDNAHGFEMFSMVIEPGGKLESEGHREGSKEFIIVNDGTLALEIGDQIYQVEGSQAISFNGNSKHSYRNDTTEQVLLTATIQYV